MVDDDISPTDKMSDSSAQSDTDERWKILVVDDEVDIHHLTRMVIKNKVFFGKGLELLEANSGQEARELLRQHSDIALILLDVVMETEHEGLEVARYTREDLNNRLTRIILRTGQPGITPEVDTVIHYDINDYKQKSELTAERLIVSIYTALRCYRDMKAIEDTKEHLKQLIYSTSEIYHEQAMQRFTKDVLEQLLAQLQK
ncbi:DUF3369 domain-containing protein [Dongshaea marina]|uniref:DUF3369 domain-containing protein n=1 Tax=Dongshaea marina TaxID=2047966 RepID=UPI000D3E90C3|nr:DUF3369 domain-containing protein [Dongshaea marina]